MEGDWRTSFTLDKFNLSHQGWESYAEIRRLAWVKSLAITLLKEGLDDSADIVQSVIEHFTHIEELFVNCNVEALKYNHEPVFLVLLRDGLNRLARIGISAKDAPSEGACLTGDHWYFVACWDPEKMAFIREIFKNEDRDFLHPQTRSPRTRGVYSSLFRYNHIDKKLPFLTDFIKN